MNLDQILFAYKDGHLNLDQAEEKLREWGVSMLPEEEETTWTQDDYGDVLLTTTDFSNYAFNEAIRQARKNMEGKNE